MVIIMIIIIIINRNNTTMRKIGTYNSCDGNNRLAVMEYTKSPLLGSSNNMLARATTEFPAISEVITFDGVLELNMVSNDCFATSKSARRMLGSWITLEP